MSAPIISVRQMRDWENATWKTGVTPQAVIANVGKIVAQRARQLCPPGDRILILAGKGNNGGDARAAFAHLKNLKAVLCPVADLKRDFPRAIRELEKHPALIVDGLFGVGMNRPLDAQWRELISRINQLQTKILAVDVPSGLNADTGEPMGAAIQAAVTLTLAAPKTGLLLPPAWPYVGSLEVAPEIGLIPQTHRSELNWTLPSDFKNFPPSRANAANKGNFGHVGIVAGSRGYHGAGVLASRGAQRAQPGLVTVYPAKEIYLPVASQLQAAMVHPWKPGTELPGKHSAILIGCGMAAKDLPEAIRNRTRKLWREARVAMVVDASALDWIRGHRGADAMRVVTPHPGEAARLLGVKVPEVQGDRVNALREISAQLGGSWVVLKGAQTLIGRASGPVTVNSSGNPHLAQGGSGDVLAGFLAGLLAQPELQKQPRLTLAYGVWAHGAAADRLTARRSNWIIEELIEEIGNVAP